MMRFLVFLVLGGCWPGLPPHKVHVPTKDFAAQLAHASTTGDAASIRSLLGPKVVNAGLWFADASCTREFAGAGEIGGGRLDEFARCLATLKIAVSTRTDALPDVAVMTYAPGFEVEARFIDRPDGPWLSWIGYAGRRDDDDALPTLTQDTAEGLRVAGERNPVIAGLDADFVPRAGYAYAWLKVCADREGAISHVDVRTASTAHAGEVLGRVPRAWRFRPFAPAGQPIPFCVLERVATPPPAKPLKEVLPPALATPHGEPLIDVRTLHALGDGHIEVSERVNAEMRRANVTVLWTLHLYCVGTDGVVTTVQLLRGSGLPDFDASVTNSLRASRYAGVTIPVCTTSSFAHELFFTPR